MPLRDISLTEVLDGEGRFLPFHLQGTFAFEVLLGGDLHFAQGLRVLPMSKFSTVSPFISTAFIVMSL